MQPCTPRAWALHAFWIHALCPPFKHQLLLLSNEAVVTMTVCNASWSLLTSWCLNISWSYVTRPWLIIRWSLVTSTDLGHLAVIRCQPILSRMFDPLHNIMCIIPSLLWRYTHTLIIHKSYSNLPIEVARILSVRLEYNQGKTQWKQTNL